MLNLALIGVIDHLLDDYQSHARCQVDVTGKTLILVLLKLFKCHSGNVELESSTFVNSVRGNWVCIFGVYLKSENFADLRS